jgi:hypothetical protein
MVSWSSEAVPPAGGPALLTMGGGYRRATVVKAVERVTGIEPASRAWKARALPLSYTRRYGCGERIISRSRRTWTRGVAARVLPAGRGRPDAGAAGVVGRTVAGALARRVVPDGCCATASTRSGLLPGRAGGGAVVPVVPWAGRPAGRAARSPVTASVAQSRSLASARGDRRGVRGSARPRWFAGWFGTARGGRSRGRPPHP